MRQEGRGLTRQERLRADNDYLKMKLMLERGAQFGAVSEDEPLPPELENRFLRSIIEFESLNENKAFVKVFDKLGRPGQFRMAGQLTDGEVEDAWKDLLELLNKHQITLGVCSPNISVRELYRFVTEELFDLQVSSVDLPGLVHGFIYDEFHPDPSFDNPRSVIEGFIEPLFSSRPFHSMHFYRKFDLRLNDHYPLSQRQFMNLVNHFKKGYDAFSELFLHEIRCTVEESDSVVSGGYKVKAGSGGSIVILEGEWSVSMSLHPVTGVWDINGVQISGMVI